MNLGDEDDRYAEIMYMSHHVSKTHPRMTISDRAAQFSAFAALTGHDEAIKDTARLAYERVETETDCDGSPDDYA